MAAVGSGIEVIYRIPVIHTTKQRHVQWDIEILARNEDGGAAIIPVSFGV